MHHYCKRFRFFSALVLSLYILASTEGRSFRQVLPTNEDETGYSVNPTTGNIQEIENDDENQDVKTSSGETTAATALDPEEAETETTTMLSMKKMQQMGILISDIAADKGADDIQVHEPEFTPTEKRNQNQEDLEEEDVSSEEDVGIQGQGSGTGNTYHLELPKESAVPQLEETMAQEDSMTGHQGMKKEGTDFSTSAPSSLTMEVSSKAPVSEVTSAVPDPPVAATTTTTPEPTTTTQTTTSTTTDTTTAPTTASTTSLPPKVYELSDMSQDVTAKETLSVKSNGAIVQKEENSDKTLLSVADEVVKPETGDDRKSSPAAETVNNPLFTTTINNEDSQVKTIGSVSQIVATADPVLTIQSEKMETTIKTVVTKEAECSEGDVIWRKKGCNLCVCSEEGFYVCRKEECASDFIPSLKKSPNAASQYTASGSMESNEDEPMEILNSTTVSTTSTTTTTTTTPKPECYSGLTKTVDCNICVCSPNSKWACTRRACIALTLREKASYSDGTYLNKTEMLVENPHLDEDCHEGQTMTHECNACVCHMNSWSCTQKECPSTTPPPRKEDMEVSCTNESDIKTVGCNVCHCTRGVWVCTRSNC